jgi:hypothetical protein
MVGNQLMHRAIRTLVKKKLADCRIDEVSRLPLLIGAFRFAALQAVILNKAMSLVVVASALPFRAAAHSDLRP